MKLVARGWLALLLSFALAGAASAQAPAKKVLR